MNNTMKISAKLNKDESETVIDVNIECSCDSKLAEKVLYCLLSGMYEKAPVTTLIAIDKFVHDKLGVNND